MNDKIIEITGKFVNNVLMRIFQAGYDWLSRQHKQELEILAQQIREAMWTTIVEGDDSTLPEYGDYLVEVVSTGGNKYHMVTEYLPNIKYWQEVPDDHNVTRWMKI